MHRAPFAVRTPTSHAMPCRSPGFPPHHCSWFYDTQLYWAECSWPCNVAITYGERFVYCLVLGFYVQVGGAGGVAWEWAGGAGNCSMPRALHTHSQTHTFWPRTQAVPMLFVWETKRKDRLETLAHHVATIVLIAYSYYLKWVAGGLVVVG